ncbi:hypothetical protein B0A55_08894 [Friedmanniomyces simplex]|uniref:Uncharacterized protein n=1 Tax=Friedmanniomyces simplex TaxID=329884 RepID=A0A4U0XB23_9PEZI|nr:hypothetical protein B0A55_08894 [Friedmanniomyces simplex]
MAREANQFYVSSRKPGREACHAQNSLRLLLHVRNLRDESRKEQYVTLSPGHRYGMEALGIPTLATRRSIAPKTRSFIAGRFDGATKSAVNTAGLNTHRGHRPEDEEQYYDAPQELTYGHASASTMPGYEAAEGALNQAVATYAQSQDSQPTPQPRSAVDARYKPPYYQGLVISDEDVEKHGLDCLEGLGARYPGHKIDYGWFCPFVRESSRAYFDRMTRQYPESTRPQREAMCAIAGLTGHFFEFMLQYQEHGPLWEWPLESWRRFVTGTWQEGDDDFWPDRGGDDDGDDEGWMAWLLSFLPNREPPSQGIEDLVDIGRPPGSTRS